SVSVSSGTGTHTRVTPVGFVTSIRVTVSNFRHGLAAVGSAARTRRGATPSASEVEAASPDFKNVRRCMDTPLSWAGQSRLPRVMRTQRVKVLAARSNRTFRYEWG